MNLRDLINPELAGLDWPLCSINNRMALHCTNPLEHPSPLALHIASMIPRPDTGFGEGIDLTRDLATATCTTSQSERMKDWQTSVLADALAAGLFVTVPVPHLKTMAAPQSVYLNRSNV